jgi:hypothetical protein
MDEVLSTWFGEFWHGSSNQAKWAKFSSCHPHASPKMKKKYP